MRTSILGLGSDLRFFICRRPVSMGKGIEALRALVAEEFGRDPTDGSVYIFIAANRKQIRLLHYRRNVFTLYVHRIYHGTFVYPRWNGEAGCYEMEWTRLRRLLEGYAYKSRIYW